MSIQPRVSRHHEASLEPTTFGQAFSLRTDINPERRERVMWDLRESLFESAARTASDVMRLRLFFLLLHYQ